MDSEESRRPPLRGMSNKVRDLYNSYVRNEDIGEQHDLTEKTVTNKTSMNMDNESAAKNVEKADAELTNRVAELEKENADLRDQLLRKVAEMENMRRRFQKEKQEMTEYANHSLLERLLPTIDDLHNALDSARKTTDMHALLQGLDMIFQKTIKIFEESGVKPIENSEGEPFNVDKHEALGHIPSATPEGHVVQEIQRGYMLRDKVLRYAKVITSAGSPHNN